MSHITVCVDSLVIHPVRRPINAESFGILHPPGAKGVVPSTPASYAVPTPVIVVLTPRAIDERLIAFVAFQGVRPAVRGGTAGGGRSAGGSGVGWGRGGNGRGGSGDRSSGGRGDGGDWSRSRGGCSSDGSDGSDCMSSVVGAEVRTLPQGLGVRILRRARDAAPPACERHALATPPVVVAPRAAVTQRGAASG